MGNPIPKLSEGQALTLGWLNWSADVINGLTDMQVVYGSTVQPITSSTGGIAIKFNSEGAHAGMNMSKFGSKEFKTKPFVLVSNGDTTGPMISYLIGVKFDATTASKFTVQVFDTKTGNYVPKGTLVRVNWVAFAPV